MKIGFYIFSFTFKHAKFFIFKNVLIMLQNIYLFKLFINFYYYTHFLNCGSKVIDKNFHCKE